jgi:hypothetical protein
MTRTVKYVLVYKRLEEKISLDQFDTVNDALAYCRENRIEDPLSIERVERIEERVLGRAEISRLLGRPE